MILDIAICDDDHEILTEMTALLNKFLYSRDRISLSFKTYDNPEALLKDVTNGAKYNILFLDIEMPGIDGIELAKNIRDVYKKDIYIVFITNYPKYVHESFTVHPFYYMNKPITEANVFALLEDLIKHISENSRSFLLIDSEDNEYPVDIEDIIFIETLGRQAAKCKVHLFSEEITAKGSLQEWKNKLSDFPFIECYRGIIVNVAYIHYIKNYTITLDNGETIPISRRCEKQIKDEMRQQIKTYLK